MKLQFILFSPWLLKSPVLHSQQIRSQAIAQHGLLRDALAVARDSRVKLEGLRRDPKRHKKIRILLLV